jgi:hypothetical protein
MGNFIDITMAAEILGLGETRARVVLYPPERCTSTINGKPRFLYDSDRVESICNKRRCEKCQRQENKGKRPCYLCNRKFDPHELTSGICEDCRAMKIMKNFICHGDCLMHKPDKKRVKILLVTLRKLKSQMSPVGKVKAI